MSAGITELVTSGPLLLAAPLALAAGVVSFFSPCCLPLVPGYLSYATGMSAADVQEARQGRGRMVAGTALFILGFSALFASYGAALGYVGNVLLENQERLTQILGALTIVLGLLFLGAFERIPIAGRTFRLTYHPRAGLAGAPLLGVMFGLGWTPCIGPTLAAVLSMSATTGTAERGALLAFVYSLGLGLPFLLAALAFRRALRVFGFARRHARTIMRIGGVMLIVVGIPQVTGAWTYFIGQLRYWVAGYQLPL
ncbi:cytochrome c biogenesis CcdA family protein [Streptomyces rhizosphaericus]|uniref:Cytochrome c biogenesis protein CcdA n=1 Tax=Streptomyces rhizosphaericus TaxID=114699 RepID=A0A6G4A6V3_9ACTN|nr:cytochrome c biogenesis protein CcdA [Streptomyces rhizosphaericus]NEW69126.1 cytochrome c biogenesis protein CcdA [Streptomyces rhizosphaericus]